MEGERRLVVLSIYVSLCDSQNLLILDPGPFEYVLQLKRALFVSHFSNHDTFDKNKCM